MPCRYFASGYCSRGERCNFAHVVEPEPESAWPAQAPASPPPSQPAASLPKVIKGSKRNSTGASFANGHASNHSNNTNGVAPSPGHKRRHSSHSPNTQASQTNFAPNAGAAAPAPFVMGTSTLCKYFFGRASC